MTVQKTKTAVVWRFSDGRPGHDTQSIGLLSALGDCIALDCFDITLPATGWNPVTLITGKLFSGKNLPDPDLLVGAGHATHLAMLSARCKRGGKTVVLMKPSLPYWCFDYCLVPEHDHPPIRNNIITTRGAINSVKTSSSHDPARGLILLGGPSKHYAWQPDAIIRQLEEIINHGPGVQWIITDSPRTPEGILELLAKQHWNNVQLTSRLNIDTRGLHELYRTCATIWVSEDSVSMVFEALTSGARVGILSMPGKSQGKIANTIDGLAQANHVTLFQDWINNKLMKDPLPNFNEASRCADILTTRLLES